MAVFVPPASVWLTPAQSGGGVFPFGGVSPYPDSLFLIPGCLRHPGIGHFASCLFFPLIPKGAVDIHSNSVIVRLRSR